MPAATYAEVHKDKIEYTIQERFAPEIRQLRELGFDEEFYIQETAFPLSFLLFFPFILYEYFKGGIFRVSPFLGMVSFNPYLIHEDTYAYGIASKFSGVRYATLFDDGTLLHTHTNNIPGFKSEPQKRYVFQEPCRGDMAGSWKKHVEKVKELADEGRNVIAPLGMKDVIRMEMRALQIVFGGKSDSIYGEAKHKKR